MKYNLLVWCAHSCRRDVFLEELKKGHLPNYQSMIEQGLFFPSAIVGGHFQRTSNLSEICGRPFTSGVSVAQNLLNAAKNTGGYVGVVDDSVITRGAKYLAERGVVGSVAEIYPNLIKRPWFENIASPKIEFFPNVEHERWLFWYRERATHRNFYNFACTFQEDGGFFEAIVNENPTFVRDQQRYSLRLQDLWFGNSLDYLKQKKVMGETLILVFSSHGTSLESWLPLVKKITRSTVDHTSANFHPNVSRSFAFMAGPGVPRGAMVEDWISIMDLKPTLCALLDIENLGGSVYGVNLIRDPIPSSRILADVSSRSEFSLFHTESSYLFMSIPKDRARDSVYSMGLPSAPEGRLAFSLREDPGCARPVTREFMSSPLRRVFLEEARRLQVSDRALLD